MTDLPAAAEFDAVLKRHVIDPWFPRCLDTVHGGFLCDFDRGWHPVGTQDKLVEFQARQTLFAADALALFPGDSRLRDATEQGFRYLRDVMWDRNAGGWFHRMDRRGDLLEGGTKHAHGAAYAIEACVAVHRVTGDATALQLAQDGFEWLDRHAHDGEQGGYFGFFTRENRVIREPSLCPYPSELDTVGTRIGLKDANVHSDLVETFTHLYRAWPDSRVGQRLAETVDLVSDRMIAGDTGALHMFVTADWHPIPHLARAGYQCQTACRFLAARGLVSDDAKLERLAVQLTDHVLRYLHDAEEGGFWYAAPGTEPAELMDHHFIARRKLWWVQVEAVKALLAMSLLRPDQPRYRDHLARQWRYVQDQFLDATFGGMYSSAAAPRRWRHRMLGLHPVPARSAIKGDVWKDASHDGRAWIYCRTALS